MKTRLQQSIVMMLCLVLPGLAARAWAQVPCEGLAVSGDYSYEVYSNAGTVYFTLTPLGDIVGSASAIAYVKEGTGPGAYPGYNMVANGGSFTFSKAIANNTVVNFYFSYAVPAGGEANSSSDPHQYLAGAVCVEGAPAVSITSPAASESFIAPANFTIEATASDVNGSVSSVEFYQGATLLATDDTSPFSYDWTSVAAGTYAIKAKAIDNDGLGTFSLPVSIVVSLPNQNGYCGTAQNGQYEFKASTTGGNVSFVMHPLGSVVGSAYAFIYTQLNGVGGFAGDQMTAVGGDFVYTKAVANGTPMVYYFTYNLPAGGENNTSANPHSYVSGSNCVGLVGEAPTVSLTSPTATGSYTEPASFDLTATAADADGSVASVAFYNSSATLLTDPTSPYSGSVNNLSAGNYAFAAKAKDNTGLFTHTNVAKVVVNISFASGFCGTIDNGDYSYKIETVGSKVLFSMRPLTPIAGCQYALIYVREGTSGPYPGYNMERIGSDFRFEKNIAIGTLLSVYFTYQVPSTGGEATSLESPHAYTVGENCIISSLEETSNNDVYSLFPNPSGQMIFLTGPALSYEMQNIQVVNALGQVQTRFEARDNSAGFDISNLKTGVYFLQWTDVQGKQVHTKSFTKL